MKDEAAPIPPLVRVVQTCQACPSQWDAWDADGRYYYLRYRFGSGTVKVCSDTPGSVMSDEEADIMHRRAVLIAEFEHGDELDGYIGLGMFLSLAGMQTAPITEGE